MLKINWNPSPRELKSFSLIWFPAFCAVLGGILWAKLGRVPATAVWVGGGTLGLASVLVPALIRYVYLSLIAITYPIGFVISHLLMGIIFYLVLTPIGLVMRLGGHDPMGRRSRSSTGSHWVERSTNRKRSAYFRQF